MISFVFSSWIIDEFHKYSNEFVHHETTAILDNTMHWYITLETYTVFSRGGEKKPNRD